MNHVSMTENYSIIINTEVIKKQILKMIWYGAVF